MPNVNVEQHVSANVPRGLDPRRGPGLQTVAAPRSLSGSPDLRFLEEGAQYRLSPERRAKGEAPVKETFFRLPSGRFAVGRITDIGGTGADGGANVCAIHLLFDAESLDRLNGDPFHLFAYIPKPNQAHVPEPSVTVAETLKVDLETPGFSLLEELPPTVLQDLVVALTEPSTRPLLLIGGGRTQPLLRALRYLVGPEDRAGLTFSSQHYQCDELRERYRLVTVERASEAPAKLGDYVALRLDADPGSSSEMPPRIPKTAYGAFALACAIGQTWPKLTRLQALQTAARRGVQIPFGHGDAELLEVLWPEQPEAIVASLKGEAKRIADLLPHSACSAPISLGLLRAGRPGEIVGDADATTAFNCLSLLKNSVPPQSWQEWVKRYENDPTWRKDPKIAALGPSSPWWKKLLGG